MSCERKGTGKFRVWASEGTVKTESEHFPQYGMIIVREGDVIVDRLPLEAWPYNNVRPDAVLMLTHA